MLVFFLGMDSNRKNRIFCRPCYTAVETGHITSDVRLLLWLSVPCKTEMGEKEGHLL